MNDPTRTGRAARLFIAGSTAALALVALAVAPPPAQAGVWVSAGVPFAGYYYAPGPYYGYYPPPYSYAPPNGYYPPAPAYPPATEPAPTAYAPQSTGIAPAAPPAGAVSAGSPRVTYTDKPAFTNSAGQTCREYKTTDTTFGHPVDVFGTACREADGQWRVVN
jgi:hypothetical protein